MKTKPTNFLTIKPKKSKQTANYYQCMLNESIKGFKGKRISQICRSCKQNPNDLLSERNNQINLLMNAYEQLGSSLRNLLTPLND